MAQNQQFAEQVKNDFTKADLSIRERRIADFTIKVTHAPSACSPQDIDGLREVGLSDKEILGLVELIAYMNFSTRLFETLSTIDP